MTWVVNDIIQLEDPFYHSKSGIEATILTLFVPLQLSVISLSSRVYTYYVKTLLFLHKKHSLCVLIKSALARRF